MWVTHRITHNEVNGHFEFDSTECKILNFVYNVKRSGKFTLTNYQRSVWFSVLKLTQSVCGKLISNVWTNSTIETSQDDRTHRQKIKYRPFENWENFCIFVYINGSLLVSSKKEKKNVSALSYFLCYSSFPIQKN